MFTEPATASDINLGKFSITPLLVMHLSRLNKKILNRKWLLKLESHTTHPPHVLVSAKVLLQSRRAKGGFSFGVKACYA